ncbi:MAG: pyridoxamine kinase [Clostridiales bacterium]|nr:pyridoxamine kinase [Clostridiales bacterium]
MKRVVSIQDISCLGKCSLTVALPVISAMGVECAILPTAVLSTHTMFPDFTCRDLSDEMLPIARHWKRQRVAFDAICTGFLASPEQIDHVCAFVDLFKTENNLLLVDPAMADQGKLYPTFDRAFPAVMARLCTRADVILPNLTEACLLTGTDYQTTYDEAYIRALLKKLTDLGAKQAALTGISFTPDKLGVMAYDAGKDAYFSYFNQRIPAHFHGTGDLFAAACTGALMNGKTLEEALALAVDFTLETIRKTAENERASWYGVEFERAIPYLIERMKK